MRIAARLCLLASLAWLAATPVTAETADFVEPGDAVLTVSIDAPVPEPFTQEMVLLRIHGVYTVEMTLEHLDQPALDDFGWMQLGRDKWTETTMQGRPARAFDRVMALFPRRSGGLTIGPFTHRLTLLSPAGLRVAHDVTSEPVGLRVRPAPSTGWWLPARTLALTDSFDKDPARLAPGETVRRTVVVEALGVSPDMLPPQPALRAPGLLAFAEPEERSGRLTRDGPVSSVTWRWTIKPTTGDPAALPAASVSWFDTASRMAKVAELPERTVGLASVSGSDAVSDRLATWRPAVLLAAGVLAFLAVLVQPAQDRRFNRKLLGRLARLNRGARAWLAVRREIRRGDAASLRRAVLAWQAIHGPDSAARLDPITHALGTLAYGPGADRKSVPKHLARAVSREFGPLALIGSSRMSGDLQA